jgi:hypothetical protein
MLEFLTFAMVTLMFIPFAADKGKVVVEFVKSKF